MSGAARQRTLLSAPLSKRPFIQKLKRKRKEHLVPMEGLSSAAHMVVGNPGVSFPFPPRPNQPSQCSQPYELEPLSPSFCPNRQSQQPSPPGNPSHIQQPLYANYFLYTFMQILPTERDGVEMYLPSFESQQSNHLFTSAPTHSCPHPSLLMTCCRAMGKLCALCPSHPMLPMAQCEPWGVILSCLSLLRLQRTVMGWKEKHERWQS